MARAFMLADVERLIRLEEKVDFFHDIDDETMDQMLEVVAAINENKDLLNGKIDYDDIVDNLDTDDKKKVLSAAQGKALKKLIEQIEISGGGILKESDPTVPDWAKQPEKPSYTADEVGADAKGAASNVQLNLTNHKADGTVHLQQGERTKWDGYGEQIGEISAALDELHAYAVSLAGGSV